MLAPNVQTEGLATIIDYFINGIDPEQTSRPIVDADGLASARGWAEVRILK